MYDSLTSFVLGFHGCDKAVAEAVFAGKASLKRSENAYDWLGHGVYFWENNPQRAFEYAGEILRRRRGRAKVVEPAVVGAVIDLERCLNLMDRTMIRMVGDAHAGLQLILREADQNPPQNTGGPDRLQRFLDCAVLEHLHSTPSDRSLPDFDTVRGVFLEGKPIYPTAGFHEKSHIQICVRHSRCIKGYFRVLPDPDQT